MTEDDDILRSVQGNFRKLRALTSTRLQRLGYWTQAAVERAEMLGGTRQTLVWRRSVLLCLAVEITASANAARILLLPTPGDNSHIYTLRAMYDELKHRGHDSYVSIVIAFQMHTVAPRAFYGP